MGTSEFKDWLPSIGWVVTFALGILSGGFIVPRLTRKRKIVAWSIKSESDIVPREISQLLGVPVTLKVGDQNPQSLSVVKLKLGGAGNEIVEDVSLSVKFNQDAQILNVRAPNDLGEFQKHVNWDITNHACRVKLDFLNPGYKFKLEFLLSNYEPGSVDVDAAAPGLEIRRLDPSRWELPTSLLRSVGFSLVGVRYDPGAASIATIAEELQAIRRSIHRQQSRGVDMEMKAPNPGPQADAGGAA